MKSILSIEGNSIIYCEVFQKHRKIQVGKFCNKSVSSLEGGLITDIEAFTNDLALFIEENDIKQKLIYVVVDSVNVITRELIIPTPKRGKLKEFVYNEVLYTIGEIEGYTVEYLVLDRQADKTKVLTFIVSNSMINSIAEAMGKLDLTCKAIDISSNAISKVISECYDGIDKVIALSLNQHSIDIYLIIDGVCILSRNIKLNVEMFLDNNSIDLLAEELFDHLNKIVQFQKTRHSESTIEKIIIMSDIESTDTICDILQGIIRIPCSIYHISDFVGGEVVSAKAASNIGAFIRRK